MRDRSDPELITENVDPDGAVGKEADSLGAELGADGSGENLLAIVYKDLGTETVQDEAQLESSVVMTDLGTALVDDGPAGPGELPIDFSGQIREDGS